MQCMELFSEAVFDLGATLCMTSAFIIGCKPTRKICTLQQRAQGRIRSFHRICAHSEFMYHTHFWVPIFCVFSHPKFKYFWVYVFSVRLFVDQTLWFGSAYANEMVDKAKAEICVALLSGFLFGVVTVIKSALLTVGYCLFVVVLWCRYLFAQASWFTLWFLIC